uniref:Uncharacterized protein n=1 Tax=Mucochytrium quahogii TaxID=96639 RepID=A0A7S2RDY4_9STRA|mmetsp:Transcript_4638/g.6945  ORF Transcript_4638/g.6945 Transcript_4638/m.6945 type:complete len:376 (-) Transcript_4638:40-1167(-)
MTSTIPRPTRRRARLRTVETKTGKDERSVPKVADAAAAASRAKVTPPSGSHQKVAVPRKVGRKTAEVHPANKIAASSSMKVAVPGNDVAETVYKPTSVQTIDKVVQTISLDDGATKKNLVKTKISPPKGSVQKVAVPRKAGTRAPAQVHAATKPAASSSMKVVPPKKTIVPQQAKEGTAAPRRVGRVRKAGQVLERLETPSVGTSKSPAPQVEAESTDIRRVPKAGAAKKTVQEDMGKVAVKAKADSTPRRVGRVRKAGEVLERLSVETTNVETTKDKAAAKQVDSASAQQVEKDGFPPLEGRYAVPDSGPHSTSKESKAKTALTQKSSAALTKAAKPATSGDIVTSLRAAARENGVHIHVHAPVNIHIHQKSKL